MEGQIVQKLKYFSELLTCGQNLYYWEYDPAFSLVSTSCPNADMIGNLLSLADCKEYLMDYIAAGQTKPLILSDTLGLSWIASFEVAMDLICRVHMIGPVFTSEISSQNLERKIGKGNFPSSMSQIFRDNIRVLPVIQLTAWFQFGLMLHYTVRGEKLTISDFNYQSEMKNRLSKGDNELKAPKINTWYAEQMAMQQIEEGRLDYQQAFGRLSMSASYIERDSTNPLRMQKNSTISFITLATRAAIRGGLDAETAYLVGEYYIKNIEAITTVTEGSQLISTMFDDFVRRVHKCRSAKTSSSIQACCNHIGMHLAGKLPLSELADISGYSELYLTQKFKKEMGCSITQYIKQQRVERAKMLLLSSKDSIQEIGESLGFCNHSYFTGSFKSIAGVTPGEYRTAKRKITE